MIIAQISDTHLIVDGPGSDRRIADFRAVLADINTLDPAPDVIVHTGDIVHNGLVEEYAAAAEILAEARAPVYVLAGNKDDRTNLRAAFAGNGYLPADTEFIAYAVDEFPLRLLMLDTVNPDSKKGDFCAARFAQLDEMAVRAHREPIVVFLHHPPFEVLVGPEPYHFDDLVLMDRLAAFIAGAGSVAGVICGHVHRPTTGRVGRVPAVVMPSVATELRYGDYPEPMQRRPIYFVHHCDPDRGLTTATHNAGNRPWGPGQPAIGCEAAAHGRFPLPD